MDNSAHFWNYNAGLPSTHRWPESTFFLRLDEQRQKRSRQMAREKKQRQTRQVLQRSVLQFLIDAGCEPVSVDDIAEHIGRSRQVTTRFLYIYADDLWIEASGARSAWMTSLRFLPDRLFY